MDRADLLKQFFFLETSSALAGFLFIFLSVSIRIS
jgi:hypothetical protein